MLRDFNNLCGSCITIFIYATVGTIGYKTGMHVWSKIENKLQK